MWTGIQWTSRSLQPSKNFLLFLLSVNQWRVAKLRLRKAKLKWEVSYIRVGEQRNKIKYELIFTIQGIWYGNMIWISDLLAPHFSYISIQYSIYHPLSPLLTFCVPCVLALSDFIDHSNLHLPSTKAVILTHLFSYNYKYTSVRVCMEWRWTEDCTGWCIERWWPYLASCWYIGVRFFSPSPCLGLDSVDHTGASRQGNQVGFRGGIVCESCGLTVQHSTWKLCKHLEFAGSFGKCIPQSSCQIGILRSEITCQQTIFLYTVYNFYLVSDNIFHPDKLNGAIFLCFTWRVYFIKIQLASNLYLNGFNLWVTSVINE